MRAFRYCAEIYDGPTKYTLSGPGKNKTPSGGDNLCLGWTTDDRLYLIKVLYIQGGRVWAQV